MTDPKSTGILRTFRASHISTPLVDALTLELSGNPKDAAELLRSHRFSQAPVRDRSHVVGWVPAAALDGALRMKSALRPLRDSAIVSSEASIADVLECLAAEGFVFTVGELGLAGFVTPSDLDRHAARSHFYLLVADVEMALADIVRHAVPKKRIVDRIGGDALERWEHATIDNNEADPVEYLYIRDLAELFLETPWGESAPPGMRAALRELCQLRPAVMHPVRQLMTRRGPAALASLARRSEALTRMLDNVASETMGVGRWK